MLIRSLSIGFLAAIFVSLAAIPAATAQQTHMGAPFHAAGDGFFEQTGTAWSLGGRGWSLSFGSPGMAAPPFGGFDPARA